MSDNTHKEQKTLSDNIQKSTLSSIKQVKHQPNDNTKSRSNESIDKGTAWIKNHLKK